MASAINQLGTVPEVAKVATAAAGTVAAAAPSKLVQIFHFLSGEWGHSVGLAYNTAKKAGTAFEFSKAYKATLVADATKSVAATAATEGAKKGILAKMGAALSKIPGAAFVGKYLFPIMTIVQTGFAMYKGSQIGGTPEALKAGLINISGLLGYGLSKFIVGALGIAGGPMVFIAGALGAIALPMLLQKLIPLEQGTPQEKEQAQQTARNGANPFGYKANQTASTTPLWEQNIRKLMKEPPPLQSMEEISREFYETNRRRRHVDYWS